MGIAFQCTKCGNCCRHFKLPLTVSEAIAWLGRGNDVQVLCEAAPWPITPPDDDLHSAYWRRRSFAAMSGSLPMRVTVILAAPLSGACPNLEADMRCAIYESRPHVCQIYPAEINPFVEMKPESKSCPPEAWTSGLPLLNGQGKIVDEGIHRLIEQARDTNSRDAHAKERLCATLRLDAAALANEGFVVYSPDRAVLLAALRQAERETAAATDPTSWRFISNKQQTIDVLSAGGAAMVAGDRVPDFEYLSFYPVH
jgi:Fe-S-cluster containining protein